MKRYIDWLFFLQFLIFIGCGGEKVSKDIGKVKSVTTPKKIVKVIDLELKNKRIYDKEGNLLPQERQVFGIPLPRGAKLIVKEPRMQRFVIKAPSIKVRDYYRKRVKSVNIMRIKYNCWEIKDGVPLPPGDPSRKVDIRIFYKGENETEFTLIDRTPYPNPKVKLLPPSQDPTPQNILKKYKRMLKQGEKPPPDTY